MAGSISIHETQCLKKFHDQQAALPAEERRRAPTRPLIGGAAPETNMFTAGEVPNCRRQERLQERAALAERLSRIEAGSDCDSDELEVLQLRIASLEDEEEHLLTNIE